MEKRQYMEPLVEVEMWNMQDVMGVSDPTGTPIDPGTQNPAPARNELF